MGLSYFLLYIIFTCKFWPQCNRAISDKLFWMVKHIRKYILKGKIPLFFSQRNKNKFKIKYIITHSLFLNFFFQIIKHFINWEYQFRIFTKFKANVTWHTCYKNLIFVLWFSTKFCYICSAIFLNALFKSHKSNKQSHRVKVFDNQLNNTKCANSFNWTGVWSYMPENNSINNILCITVCPVFFTTASCNLLTWDKIATRFSKWTIKA